MRVLSLAFLGIMLLLPVTLVAAGLAGAIDQARASRSVAVAARVLDTDVRVATAIHSATLASTSFRPIVRYAYRWEGRDLEGDRVTFLDREGDRAWAEMLAYGFEPGETVTAYVDPERPERSFLLKRFRATPYALLLAAIPLLLLWDFARRRVRERWTVPPAHGRLQLLEQTWNASLFAGVWAAIGVFVVVHGMLHADRTPTAVESALLLGYAALGAPLLVHAVRVRRRRRSLDPPVVELLAPARPGGDLQLDVAQDVRRGLDIGAWRLRARCEETSRPGSAVHEPGLERRTVFEETRELVGRTRVEAEESLRARVEVPLPAGLPSTSHPAQGTPRWDWTLELELVTEDRRRHTSTWPLQVGDVAAPRPREW